MSTFSQIMVINLYTTLYSHLQEDTLGKRIKNNLSVADAAKLLDTDRCNIYRWENGDMVVSRKNFGKIRDKLNLKRTKEL